MDSILLTIVSASIVLLLLLISIARRTKFQDKISLPLFTIIVVCGLIIYGYGYALSDAPPVTAIVRTALQTVMMFTGGNNYDLVKNTPLFSYYISHFIFWMIHLLAFYMTAGALLSMIGSAFILKNRGLMLRLSRKNVNFIFGTDSNAFRHAEALKKNDPKSVIAFISNSSMSDYTDFINKFGYVILDSEDARFEKTLGLKSKKNIQLYCIHNSETDNVNFALFFATLLENTQRTAFLTIHCREKTLDRTLRLHNDVYSSIFSYSEPELTARLATREASFVDHVKFNNVAIAQNDLNIVIVGFGTLGQEVFCDTLRNTQFEGAKTHYYIIDRILNNLSGPFLHNYDALFEEYDITLIGTDCRSETTIASLQNKLDEIDFVFLCVGSAKENKELAYIWEGLVKDSCTIIQCYDNTIKKLNDVVESRLLYGSDVLITKSIDDRAMKVNQLYNGSDNAQRAWDCTDAFSRQSSRAMADFVMTYKKIMETVPIINDEVLENLSKTEHLRWCAFHYTKGYRVMNEDIIRQRTQLRNKQIEENGFSDLRITVDREKKLHACLVPWDKLDDLDELVYKLTGTKTDYKELDRQNVRNIEQFLN